MSGKTACIVICLLYGVLLRRAVVESQTVRSDLIRAGNSIGQSTLKALLARIHLARTCGIEIENWTRFPLHDSHIEINGGVNLSQPVDIASATKEALFFRKTYGTATGKNIYMIFYVIYVWSSV